MQKRELAEKSLIYILFRSSKSLRTTPQLQKNQEDGRFRFRFRNRSSDISVDVHEMVHTYDRLSLTRSRRAERRTDRESKSIPVSPLQ